MTLEGGDWLAASRSADGAVASPRAVVAAGPEVVPFAWDSLGPEALARGAVAQILAGPALEAIETDFALTTFPTICFLARVVI